MAWLPKILAVLVVLFAALLVSPRVQSLLVFLQWLNWPPFRWSDPAEPSPPWSRPIGNLLGTVWKEDLNVYDGMQGVEPFIVQGPSGALRCWRIHRRGPGQCVIVYLHGNAYNLAVSHRTKFYKRMSTAPFSCEVVAVDYSGFGFSDGWWQNESLAVADAVAVLEALPPPWEQLVVWGHSLGSGIATAAMAELMKTQPAQMPGGLILEGAFTSVPDVPASFCSWLPAPMQDRLRSLLHSCLWAHRFPTVERIGTVASSMKVAVFHGLYDDVVSHMFGQRVADHAGVPLETFAKYHNDLPEDPSFNSRVVSVLNEWDVKTR